MFLEIQELVRTEPDAMRLATRLLVHHLHDLDEPIGSRKRQRTEQHAVDYAEDRRRRADAECERDDAHHREAGIACQRPDRKTEISKQRFHQSLLKAETGSRRIARRPGITQATAATDTSTVIATPSVTGSVPSTRVIAT